MNKGDKVESELLDGTKIKYTLDNIDISKTVLLDGTKMYDDCMFISEENIKK